MAYDIACIFQNRATDVLLDFWIVYVYLWRLCAIKEHIKGSEKKSLFNIAEFTASILTMSLNLHNEIWLSLITILDPALDGWELRWFCWLQGFNVAFQNLMWFSLPSINWKTPEVLQLFLKDNTFKIALVGWRKVIKARREALNNSWDSDMFSS